MPGPHAPSCRLARSQTAVLLLCLVVGALATVMADRHSPHKNSHKDHTHRHGGRVHDHHVKGPHAHSAAVNLEGKQPPQRHRRAGHHDGHVDRAQLATPIQSAKQAKHCALEEHEDVKFGTTWEELIHFFLAVQSTGQLRKNREMLDKTTAGTWAAACIFLNLGYKVLEPGQVPVNADTVKNKCNGFDWKTSDSEWKKKVRELVEKNTSVVDGALQTAPAMAMIDPVQFPRAIVQSLLRPLGREAYAADDHPLHKTMILLGGPTSVGKSRVTDKILKAAFADLKTEQNKAGKDVLFLDNDYLEGLAVFEKTDLAGSDFEQYFPRSVPLPGEVESKEPTEDGRLQQFKKLDKPQSSRKWIKTYAMDMLISAEVGFVVSSRADSKNEADLNLSIMKYNGWDTKLLLILASSEHLSCTAYKRWAEQIVDNSFDAKIHVKPAQPEDLKLTTKGIHKILKDLKREGNNAIDRADPEKLKEALLQRYPNDEGVKTVDNSKVKDMAKAKIDDEKVYVLFNELCDVKSKSIEANLLDPQGLLQLAKGLSLSDPKGDEDVAVDVNNTTELKKYPMVHDLLVAFRDIDKKSDISKDMAKHCFLLGIKGMIIKSEEKSSVEKGKMIKSEEKSSVEVSYSQHDVKSISLKKMTEYFPKGEVGEVASAEKQEKIVAISMGESTCSK